MYFPQAGIEVSPWVPPLAALVISFFTSMGGVSGAFLLLPFQMSVLGASNPSLSSTNQFYNIIAIPSGVIRYVQEGRMVWPLARLIVLGTLPGVLAGAVIRITLLPDRRSFLPFVAAVLIFIGLRVARDILGPRGAARKGVAAEEGRDVARVHAVNRRDGQICFEFQGETFAIRPFFVLALSALVGIVGGIYGIGGGSIIAPVLTSHMGLPVYAVAGAALLGTLVTSVAGVVFFLALAPFFPHLPVAPDWGLGLLFGLGGMVGMYLGARCQRFVPARAIKVLLAVALFFTAGKYLVEFLA